MTKILSLISNPEKLSFSFIYHLVLSLMKNDLDLSLGMLTHDFNYAKTKLGFDFNFHSLRHYAASIMHANNIPTQYIMERGGWKSERTLNRIYRNSLDDYTKKYNEMTNDFYSKNFT